SMNNNGNMTGINNLNSNSSRDNFNGDWGWVDNRYGFTTTNSNTISRFFDFLYANNGVLTNNQINVFITNEFTIAGQKQNNIQLYGNILNNVNVTNNYKGPSTIPQGMFYNNGILEISNPANNDGGVNTGTSSTSTVQPVLKSAVLTSFTRDQIVDGFKRNDFSGMSLESVTDWDPLKNDFNYMNRFQPTMKLNEEAAIAIALYEKLSLSVYDKDGSSAGNTTIGFGHLLHTGPIRANDMKKISMNDAIIFFSY
uniref:hypothetical protein n=1 Tax=Flavobacterium sp. UGB4466 TaxID=2730889 RepID=UPI001ED8EEDC